MPLLAIYSILGHFWAQNTCFYPPAEKNLDKFSLKVYIIVLTVKRSHFHNIFISIETVNYVFISVEKSSQKRQIFASANLFVT